jgi:uncharacterized protein (TIGR00269 family)
VYISKKTGERYCKKHFLEYFDKTVKETIDKFKLFGHKENIIVAVSGGKDSLSLLHYLNNLTREYPDWELTAILIDEGIKGYRDITIKDFKKNVEELRVDYKIYSFKDFLGTTLDDIIDNLSRSRENMYPCKYCGVFRRYILNIAARELSGTVLATAHNLDDVIQTYILNILLNNLRNIANLAPVTGVAEHEKFVKKVKPFYMILERETTLYSIINRLYPKFVECPYASSDIRWDIRVFINSLEEEKPGIKYKILDNLLTLINFLRSRIKEDRIGSCRVCGEPTSTEICRACSFRIKLNLPIKNS